MIFFLTPQSFMFISCFFVFMSLLFVVDSFYMFWSIMEFSTLVFMGFNFSCFKNNFSSLLIFFIIQSLSALLLLVSYCISLPFLFTISVLLKLSMFPFYFWFLNLLPSFPNFVLFFSSTFFKLPSMLLLMNFYSSLSLEILISSSVLTLFIGAVAMLFSSDFRFVLICSSVSNNAWFVFSQMVSFYYFILYFTVYSFFLMISLSYLKESISSFSCLHSSSNKLGFYLSFFTLAGIPPFPLFFLKMVVVLFLISLFSSHVFLFFVMLFSVIMVLGYLKQIFSSIMNNYSAVFVLI